MFSANILNISYLSRARNGLHQSVFLNAFGKLVNGILVEVLQSALPGAVGCFREFDKFEEFGGHGAIVFGWFSVLYVEYDQNSYNLMPFIKRKSLML